MAENSEYHDRLQKLNLIREAKVNPFAYGYDRTHTAADALALGKKGKLRDVEKIIKSKAKKTMKLCGRVMTSRVHGKLSFANLMDVSGQIQICFMHDLMGKDDYKFAIKKVDMADFVGVEGELFETRHGEITLLVYKLELLSKALRPLPEKWHGLKDDELRYRKRYLDLIMNPEVKEIFVKRAKIYKAIREFLDEKGFMEVHTPILQTQYGGANARPFVTNINAWDMPMYLRIAYELHLKRLMVGGFEKVYDLSSCFRNEGVDQTHNPEFAMMELQWAYADYNNMMEITEQLFEYVAKKVFGSTVIDYRGTKIDVKAPWKRLTVKAGLKKYAKIDVDKLTDKQLLAAAKKNKIEIKGNPVRGDLISLLFEELCEDKLIQPTHVIDHPIESCPLSKPHRKDPTLIERVEPYINGWEFGNGYSELTDPVMQRKHFEEQVEKGRGGDEESHPMDEDFVEALEHGLPPNAGMGIGIERMIMLLTAQEGIRDILLFPTMKPIEDKNNG